MKRLISWMLVLCMALSLMPAGLAEEFFAEESFFDAPTGEDENLFFEEGFFGDDSFFAVDGEEAAAVEGEDDLEFGELETRSIVSFVTDEVDEIEVEPTTEEDLLTDAQIAALSDEKYAEYEARVLAWTTEGYWKVKPLLWSESDETDEKASDTIFLSWRQFVNDTDIFDEDDNPIDSYPGMGVIFLKTAVDKATGKTIPVRNKKTGRVSAKTIGRPTAMPKNVKYYIYAVNEDTGASYQVGNAIAAKPFKEGKEVYALGNSLPLKKMDGNYTFFVRAEKNVEQKATKKKVETYGISSDKVYPRAASLDWRKKVTKIAAAQQGNEIVVSWTDDYKALDGFLFRPLKGKGESAGDILYLSVSDAYFDGIEGDYVFEDEDAITVNGTTYTYRWPLPEKDDGTADYLPTDKFYFEITPGKIFSEYDDGGYEDILYFGQAATSGKVKPAELWKTLSDFEISEVNSLEPIDHSEVFLRWTVPEADVAREPITYTIGGLVAKATIEISMVDGNPVAVETSKKPVFVGDNGEFDAYTDGEDIRVEIIAPVKVAATAKVTVQPAQGKVKGNKATATLTFAESFTAKPTITSGAQIGENKAQLTFTQGSELHEGEIFEIVGFNGVTQMQNSNGVFTNIAPAAKKSDAEMDWVIEDGELVYMVSGSVKPVAKDTTVKFTVQPKMAGMVGGKAKTVAGTKSGAFAVTVMPTLTAAAMNIQIGGIQTTGDEHVLPVTFTELPSSSLDTAKGIAIKSISASLVAVDSFDGGYSQRWTITRAKDESGAWTDGWDPDSDVDMIVPFVGEAGNYEATFTKSAGMDIRPEARYTVFIETYLLVWDKSDNNKKGDWVEGGRSIDTVTSIAGGKDMKDPALMEKPNLDKINHQIARQTGEYFWKENEESEDLIPILLTEERKLTLDLSELTYGENNKYPSGTTFGYTINGGRAIRGNMGETTIWLEDGVNKLIFWAEINGVTGVKSDAATVTAFEPIAIDGFESLSPTAWEVATLTVSSYKGGTGNLTGSVYDGDQVEHELPEDSQIILPLPATAKDGDIITFTLRVTDQNIYKYEGEYLIHYAEQATAEVEKSEDAQVDAFTYRLASADALTASSLKKAVQVVDYDPEKYVPAGESDSATKPIVPVEVTIEGNLYQVIEIGGTGTGDDLVGAFEGDAIEAITLPNAVVIIGANAFKDCESLATMTCYPDAQ